VAGVNGVFTGAWLHVLLCAGMFSPTSGRESARRPPKEQPPRKLSGNRTAWWTTLWKAERQLPPKV